MTAGVNEFFDKAGMPYGGQTMIGVKQVAQRLIREVVDDRAGLKVTLAAT